MIKRMGIVLILAAMVSSSSGATVAYYRLEEGAANTVASGAGAVLDSSGNGLNGTALNGPIYKSSVPVSTIPQTGAQDALAMQFSGLNLERVLMADNPKFQLTHSLTIEAYVNVAAIPNAAGSIFFRGDDRSGLDPYFINVETGLVRFGFSDASNGETLLTAPLPGLNQWFSIAATLDDSTGKMSLYLNNVLKSSLTTTKRPLGPLDPTQEPGVAIGSHPSTVYGDFLSFDGLIDEVRLSDTALQPSQFLNVPEPAVLPFLAIGIWGALVRRRASFATPTVSL